MPANLTPQYRRAESQYRIASHPKEAFEALQAMLREIPKHKGTDHMQAELKSKIAKLRLEIDSKKSYDSSVSHQIQRQGNARIVLIGATNSGKSSLIAKISSAKPLIGDYPFTTTSAAPAMMTYEKCLIQLIDTPAIDIDRIAPDILTLIRGADLVWWIVDESREDYLNQLQEHWRLFSNQKTRLGTATCCDEDDIGVTMTKTIVVLNKSDLNSEEKLESSHDSASEPIVRWLSDLGLCSCRVSATTGFQLDILLSLSYQSLELKRVYCRNPKTRVVDWDGPLFLQRDDNLVDLADLIHKDLKKKMHGAKIWSHGAKQSVKVNLDYVPVADDVIELQIK